MAAAAGAFCKSLTRKLRYGRALRRQFASKETKVTYKIIVFNFNNVATEENF